MTSNAASVLPEREMDWFRQHEIAEAARACQSIFDSGILSSDGARTPYFQPSVVYLLINLNDLLQKAAANSTRIAFSDHIEAVTGVNDVTTLVNKCRNAACHIGSKEAHLDAGRFRFNVVFGHFPNAMVINGVHYGSDFADDIALFYGQHRLYFRRHALRAFEEACAVLGVSDRRI